MYLFCSAVFTNVSWEILVVTICYWGFSFSHKAHAWVAVPMVSVVTTAHAASGHSHVLRKKRGMWGSSLRSQQAGLWGSEGKG